MSTTQVHVVTEQVQNVHVIMSSGTCVVMFSYRQIEILAPEVNKVMSHRLCHVGRSHSCRVEEGKMCSHNKMQYACCGGWCLFLTRDSLNFVPTLCGYL